MRVSPAIDPTRLGNCSWRVGGAFFSSSFFSPGLAAGVYPGLAAGVYPGMVAGDGSCYISKLAGDNSLVVGAAPNSPPAGVNGYDGPVGCA